MSKSINPREKILCLSNGSINAIRYYLRTTSITPERFTGQDVLFLTNQFLKQDPKSKKWQAHILYFLHLDLPEVEKIKPTPGYFSLVNVDYDPIIPSYYISAVFYIRLHEYFLQMVSTLGPHMLFARNLLSMAVDRIVGSSEQQQERLSEKEWLLYLITTAQLLRINPQDDFYRQTFMKLFKTFIALPYELMPAFARADVLLRLAGIISLTKMDYEGSSEIADSIKELKFDPFARSSSSGGEPVMMRMDNTSEAFESMFGCTKVDCTTFPQLEDFVKLIGVYLNELQLTEGEKESLKRLDDLPRKLQKAIHYIGDCAYLTRLIVNKNLPNLYLSTATTDTTSLLYFTAYIEQFKSKIRCEDYDTRNMKFTEFSNVLRSSKLKYAHHQTSWFEKFLNYEESLTTPEGYSLAKDVIVPKVDLQIGLQIVKKILRLYSTTTVPLDEELKEILLALVITNENLHKEFDQIVNLLMKKEIHTGFCTSGFQSQLNDVSSKLGADSSFDPTTLKLSITCIRSCQRLALQNPKVACQTLLLRTMQLPKGGVEVLEALRCFWNLPFTAQLDPASCVSNLFDYCLKEICVQVTDETMRNMQTKLAKFVPHLLRNNFITADKFAAIVHSMIISFNNTESNEKIGLLVDIYGSVVNFVILEENLSTAAQIGSAKNPSQEQFIQEAYYRLYGLSRVAIWSKAMDIYAVRDKCLEICDNLKKFRPSLVKSDPESDSKLVQLFDDISLVNKVLVYVRKSESRHVFQELLKNGKFVSQHDVAPTSKDLANCIRNTSPTEWDDLIEILYEVFLHLNRNLVNDSSSNNNSGDGQKLDDYRELAFQQLFSVLKKVPAFELPNIDDDADCIDDEKKSSKPTSSRQNRNPVPSVIYQRFAHHLVHVIERGHSVFMNFSLRHEEQYDLVYSFVSLIANYPDDREYHRVKQLTFISLLGLATWIVKCNPDYETKLKDRVLECLEEVRDEEEKGKHGSIARSIITVFKLTEPQAQSIIPVERAEAAGDGETDETDQEIRLRFLNEDAIRINQMTHGSSTSSSKTTDEQYPFKDPLAFYKSVKMKVLTMAEGKK